MNERHPLDTGCRWLLAMVAVSAVLFQTADASQNALAAKTTIALQRVAIPGGGLEMGLGVTEFPPNSAKPRQKAAGPELLYVLDGSVILRIEGQAARVFHAGQSFQIPANVVHVTTAGPNGAKLIATWVHVPGKPFNMRVSARKA